MKRYIGLLVVLVWGAILLSLPAQFVATADVRTKMQAAMAASAAAGTTYVLPPGDTYLDSALFLTSEHSGLVLEAHAKGSRLINSKWNTLPYPESNVLVVAGSGMGYVDGISPQQPDKSIGLLSNPAVFANYPEGSYCHGAVYDGYMAPTGMQCIRLKVMQNAAGRLKFDRPLDDKTNFVKSYVGGVPCEGATEGKDQVTVMPVALSKFPLRSTVYITGGPCIANGTEGEYRVVSSFDGTTVGLDRPLRMAHPSAIILRPTMPQNITIRGVEFLGIPRDAAQYTTVFVLYGRGITFDKVTCSAGAFSLVSSDMLKVKDSKVQMLLLNSVRDTEIIGGRMGTGWHEEAASDVDWKDVLIGWPLLNQNGLASDGGTQVQRIRTKDCRIEGIGNLIGGWPASPLILGGRECQHDNLRIAGSKPGAISFLWGDKGRLNNSIWDAQVQVTSGVDWQISGIRGSLVLRDIAGGQVTSCSPTPYGDSGPLSNLWQLWPPPPAGRAKTLSPPDHTIPPRPSPETPIKMQARFPER